jgi:hypothetical protein
MRRPEPQEQLRVLGCRTRHADVASYCIRQRIDQWAYPRLTLLGAWDGQGFPFPIDVLETNPLHLTCSEPVHGEQEKHGSVAYVDLAISFCRG